MTSSKNISNDSRRQFLKHSAAAAATVTTLGSLTQGFGYHQGGSGTIHVGLIGCGGRGTKAALQALTADPDTKLVAAADAFQERMDTSMKALQRIDEVADRIVVEPDKQFIGFDAYKSVLDAGVDMVILATPPHFRPEHLKAAVDANKHVFAEKPVAVDAPGVRSVLETSKLAAEKNLMLVSGLCWRYEDHTIELMKRIHDGAIGTPQYVEAIRYLSGVRVTSRRPGMTEMEYQMANWYYFTWLSGDFNVEQHVHELDKAAWLIGEYPSSCTATGGRLVRTGEQYGHIYDHFAGVFDFPGGAKLYASTRQQPNCDNMNTLTAIGTEGRVNVKDKLIEGQHPFHDTNPRTDMHQREHDALFAALRAGEILNNGEYMAHSTLMGIMQRMSAYTGQTITWDMALNSTRRLGPDTYDWNAAIDVPEVALPGVYAYS